MLTNSEVNEMIREETLRGHRQSEHLRKAIMPTRTKRLPCGRTVREIERIEKQLRDLLEVCEKAKGGEKVEVYSDVFKEWFPDQFSPILIVETQSRQAEARCEVSQSTPLTWDRWRDLLLPHGWTIYDGSLTSPASPCGVHCWIINHGADGLLFHIQKGAKYLTPEIPSTPYQMMSLLHGLKIPLGSNPVHPPNPHSGKPVEKTEQVSNQADTRT